MKKLFIACAAILFCNFSFAQDSTKIKEKKAVVHSGKTCQKPVKVKKA